MDRKTILFVAEAVTLAHVARPWALARSLDPQAYRVVFAVDGRFDALFDFSGMQREPLRSISSERFLQALAKGSPLYDAATLSDYVAADQQLLERIRPDLVVGDFRLSLSVSARLANIPYVTLSNIYWSPYVQQAYPVPELPLTRILGVKAGQFLFDRVRPLAFAMHTRPLNRVRKSHGLTDLGWQLQRVYTDADYVLYADHPGLSRHAPLPPEHRFIGPIVWSPQAATPQWWDDFDTGRPLVYATLGSSGNPRVLPGVMETLSHLGLQAMVATAGADLQGTPASAEVKYTDYLSGSRAAERSALVICNGGSPTTYQALAAGVPVIGIATNLDQFLNMSSLERAGLGVLLRSDTFSIAGLHQAVERLLGGGDFTRRAAGIREQLAERPAAGSFRVFLKEVL